jgi:hypothetical protein
MAIIVDGVAQQPRESGVFFIGKGRTSCRGDEALTNSGGRIGNAGIQPVSVIQSADRHPGDEMNDDLTADANSTRPS